MFGTNDNTIGTKIENPNILVDYTLESEIIKNKLNTNCRESIIQGFEWAEEKIFYVMNQ